MIRGRLVMPKFSKGNEVFQMLNIHKHSLLTYKDNNQILSSCHGYHLELLNLSSDNLQQFVFQVLKSMDHKIPVQNFEEINLEPTAFETSYVYVSESDPDIELISASLGTFKESEGVSMVIDKVLADKRNLTYDLTYKLITIGIYSSLKASGLTAKVSTALAAQNIPCNMIAAYHHDHLLIPEDLATHALRILKELR